MAETAKAQGTLDDLDSMTVQDLTALIKAAEEKRTEKLETAKRDLVTEFREKAASLGLSFESLLSGGEPAKSGQSREKAAVKYRGPNGEEWSGRGRQPRWLAEAEAAGRNRDEFKV